MRVLVCHRPGDRPSNVPQEWGVMACGVEPCGEGWDLLIFVDLERDLDSDAQTWIERMARQRRKRGGVVLHVDRVLFR